MSGRVEQKTVPAHWNERADTYLFNMKKDLFGKKAEEGWKEVLGGFIGDRKDLSVLDAGCGPAVMTRMLLELGHRVTGVDVSEKMLVHAKASLGPLAEKAAFYRGDAAELPFPDASFDLVVTRYVVWTLPDPGKALREWLRVLKPGGRVAVIDANHYYHYFRSLPSRLVMRFRNFLYYLRAGRDPGQKSAASYAGGLDSTKALRPHWDFGLLAGAGFVKVGVDCGLEKRIYGCFSPRRLTGRDKRVFIAYGEKPL